MPFKLLLNFCWRQTEPAKFRNLRTQEISNTSVFAASAYRNHRVSFRPKIRTDRTTFRYFATRRNTETSTSFRENTLWAPEAVTVRWFCRRSLVYILLLLVAKRTSSVLVWRLNLLARWVIGTYDEVNGSLYVGHARELHGWSSPVNVETWNKVQRDLYNRRRKRKPMEITKEIFRVHCSCNIMLFVEKYIHLLLFSIKHFL